MTANRRLKTLLAGALVLGVLAGTAPTVSAQSGPSTAPRADREQLRDRIQDRIRTAQDLTADERATMRANLEACLRSGVTEPGLEAVFPGGGRARPVSTPTMLHLQTRLRAMAQDGLPVEPILAKVQEALMKGVPDAGLTQVSERIEKHVREAKRIMTQAQAEGFRPAPDARRERQMLREMAQQMWRGTSAADVDELRTRARDRLRVRECSIEDLVAASETATRLREEGVESRRALRVTGEALRQGYRAEEMRRLQFMMVYRHREGRAAKDLVDDFEYCLGAGMDTGHMYQYMMRHGWMGPGDVQGPGGSRPIDDQGHGGGSPGGGGSGDGMGGGSGMGGQKGGH